MNKIIISQRYLSQSEAELFSHEIAHTPNITGYRPSELLKLHNVIVAERSSQTVGMLAYVETTKLVDLKLLIIQETERGKGYGKQLMNTAFKDFSSKGKPIYTVTRNPIVINMVLDAGFVKVRFLKLPIACQLHQIKMVFSLYRIKETIRKLYTFPNQPHFTYYIKLQ